MQKETKDQDCASLPDPLQTRKLKQKKTFDADIFLFLNAFIRPAGTPCNRQGQSPDGRYSLLRASASVHEWCSRCQTNEVSVKLNVPIGNRFSLAHKCSRTGEPRGTKPF